MRQRALRAESLGVRRRRRLRRRLRRGPVRPQDLPREPVHLRLQVLRPGAVALRRRPGLPRRLRRKGDDTAFHSQKVHFRWEEREVIISWVCVLRVVLLFLRRILWCALTVSTCARTSLLASRKPGSVTETLSAPMVMTNLLSCVPT